MKPFRKNTRNCFERTHFFYKMCNSSSDNKFIVSGSSDKTIIIWNLLEKRQETVLQGHTDYVFTVAVTQDDKYIISGTDKDILTL